jgi:hypothetical protein
MSRETQREEEKKKKHLPAAKNPHHTTTRRFEIKRGRDCWFGPTPRLTLLSTVTLTSPRGELSSIPRIKHRQTSIVVMVCVSPRSGFLSGQSGIH